MDDKDFMHEAINVAIDGLNDGGGPFGACVVKDGKILSCEHNTVITDKDPTAHAEINAIRKAAKKLGTHDLSGCEIFSTTEPCPMCFTAIHWAKITKITYGTSTHDAKDAGLNELMINDSQLKELGGDDIEIVAGFLKDECAKIFELWEASSGKAY